MRIDIVFARLLLQLVARRDGKFCVGLCLEPSFVSEVCRAKDRLVLCPRCVRFEGGAGGGSFRGVGREARWIRSTTTVSKMAVGNVGSRSFVPPENFHRRKNGLWGVVLAWGGRGVTRTVLPWRLIESAGREEAHNFNLKLGFRSSLRIGSRLRPSDCRTRRWEAGRLVPTLGHRFMDQWTSTSTVACSTERTTSSNLRSRVLGSLSLAATAGRDSRKLRR